MDFISFAFTAITCSSIPIHLQEAYETLFRLLTEKAIGPTAANVGSRTFFALGHVCFLSLDWGKDLNTTDHREFSSRPKGRRFWPGWGNYSGGSPSLEVPWTVKTGENLSQELASVRTIVANLNLCLLRWRGIWLEWWRRILLGNFTVITCISWTWVGSNQADVIICSDFSWCSILKNYLGRWKRGKFAKNRRQLSWPLRIWIYGFSDGDVWIENWWKGSYLETSQ